MSENRRTSTRHSVSIVSKLTVDGAADECTLVNLSLGGAQVVAKQQLPMGVRCQLAFRVPTLEDVIDVGATVRWADDQGVGLQFDGLRARDVWGLNEYFKQLAP